MLVHCKGGYGRAGMMGGLLLQLLKPGIAYHQLIKMLHQNLSTRAFVSTMMTPLVASQFGVLYNSIHDTDHIFFGGPKDMWFFLSPLYKKEDGTHLFVDHQFDQWYSVEGYRQAYKYKHHPRLFRMLRDLKNPVAARALGEGNKKVLHSLGAKHLKLFGMVSKSYPDYPIKGCSKKTMNHVWNANYYKFSQNPQMKELLLKTGKNRLVYYSRSDSLCGTFWTNQGGNCMGILLEELRCVLSNEENSPAG